MNALNKEVLGSDKSYSFLYKKSEKLVTAIYMVTSLFPDAEPLRNSLRNVSLKFLRLNLLLGGKMMSDREKYLNEIKENIVIIISYFDIGYMSGIISEMNLNILKNEFELLIGAYNDLDTKSQRYSKGMFSEEFFDIKTENEVDQDNSPIAEKRIESPRQVISSERSIRTAVSKMTDRKNGQITANGAPLKGHLITDKKNKRNNIDKYHPVGGAIEKKKISRRSIIIGLLEKKGEVSIKDITDFLTNCSEKTVQRELVSMVCDGVVKRDGDRRWSRYHLSKPI